MKPQIRNALERFDIEDRGSGWYRLPNGQTERGAVNAVRAVAGARNHDSHTLERLRFARRAGLQYAGERDIYKAAGYVAEDKLGWDHYWSYYDRHDVAGRIVDMPAQTTWRNPPTLTQDEDEDTDFTKAFNALAKRLRLWHRFERADRLARIGRFGVLVMGVRGDGDDRALREDMPGMDGPDDVLYLSAFPEGDVKIDRWVTDTGDPRFGQPEIYEIDLGGGVPGFPSNKQRIHWTRVLHIAEDLLADEVFGRPVLKRIMNRFMDDEKVMASTGEAFWQLADRILQAKLDGDAPVDEPTINKLGEGLEEIVNDLRRQAVIQGGELSWLGGETPDPTGPANVFATRIAAAAGIPKRILFGSETGERASTQDERQYLGSINERQERIAEPVIVRAFIDRLVAAGALPDPGQNGYDVAWPNLFELDEEAEAELSKTRAETAAALTPIGGDPRTLVTIDENNTVHLRPLTEEEADQLATATPMSDLPPEPPEAEAA